MTGFETHSQLCETGVFATTAIKTKHRKRLCMNNDLRMCPTNINPRIDLLYTCDQNASPAITLIVVI